MKKKRLKKLAPPKSQPQDIYMSPLEYAKKLYEELKDQNNA